MYEIEWELLSQVLERFTSELEWTCYVSASGVEIEEGSRFGSRFRRCRGEIEANSLSGKDIMEESPAADSRSL